MFKCFIQNFACFRESLTTMLTQEYFDYLKISHLKHDPLIVDCLQATYNKLCLSSNSNDKYTANGIEYLIHKLLLLEVYGFEKSKK